MKYVDFIAAGQKCGVLTVSLTLMATILGASATLGVAARAETIGFPAVWWLLSGAVGLVLQGMVLSARIRESGARTLPELAGLKVGASARRMVAGVVGLSWPAVVAAQLIAFAGLWNALAGTEQRVIPIAVCAGVVTLYTLTGGQRAVVRTDGPQMVVLAAGFVGLFICVFTGQCGGTSVPTEAVRLFSPDFNPGDAVCSLLTVGGAYFLGPDIASRSLVARDGRTARRAFLAAAPALAVFGAAIALAGIWASANVPGAGNPILRIAALLPAALRIFLAAGLFCAILSSVDTCLMNAAAIVAGDLLGRRSIRASRVAVAVIGVVAVALALSGDDIIGVLLKAYSVYTPGVVCPLAVAIVARRVKRRLWFASVVVGGLCGLAGAFIPGVAILPVVGMGLSLLLAIASAIPSTGESRD